ncbi:N-acetylmuramoyl-L-alanine amidase [Bernardetia sp. ABR2-2B]|uniref:N-acetylmuramoyl-L-alanine amidase n=1 Tax=Bernardetia sp. ABR2-2B TaxID=3127472 RepID=UPI0030CDA381
MNYKSRFLLVLLLLFGVLPNLSAQTLTSEYENYFDEAQNETGVPKELLKYFSWTQTRLRHIKAQDYQQHGHDEAPQALTLFGLYADGKGIFQNTLSEVALGSSFTEEELLNSPQKTILATAKWIEQYVGIQLQNGYGLTEKTAYLNALVSLTGIDVNAKASAYVIAILKYDTHKFLSEGLMNQQLHITPIWKDVEVESLLSVNEINLAKQENAVFRVEAVDYSSAEWIGSPNFRLGRTQTVSQVAIHVPQGNFRSVLYTFANAANQVSYHYLVSSDGNRVVQFVNEDNTAWHVGSANPFTIGVGHEGYVDNPAWFTQAMFERSADVTKSIAERHNIDLQKCYNGTGLYALSDWQSYTVLGHTNFPASININGHTDPGLHWNWNTYYSLLNESDITLRIQEPMKFMDYQITSNHNTPYNIWTIGQSKQFIIRVKNITSAFISKWLQLVAISPSGERLVVWNNEGRNVSFFAGQTRTLTLDNSTLVHHVTRSDAGGYKLVLEGGNNQNDIHVVASQENQTYNPHSEDVVIENPYITISESTMNYPAYSSFQNRTIEANMIVTYQASEPWITFTPSAPSIGTGFYARNSSTRINVSENTSSVERRGTITITEFRLNGIPSSYNLPQRIVRTIPIVQAGAVQNDPAEMQIRDMRSESSTIPANGINWEAFIDNPGDQTMEWTVSTYLNNAGVSTVVNPSGGNLVGDGTRNLNVWIPENTTTSSREWKITFENREAAPSDPNRFKTFIYTQEGSTPILTAARLDVRNAPNESRRIAASGESFTGIYINNIGQQLMDWISTTTLNGTTVASVVNPSSGTDLRAGGFTEVAFDFPPNTTSSEKIWEIEIENEDAAPNDPERFFRRRYIQEAEQQTNLQFFDENNREIFSDSYTIEFGNLNLGSEIDKFITISNPNSNSITIQNATIDGVGFSFVNPVSDIPLSNGGSYRLMVKFSPTRVGSHLGILTINYGNGLVFTTSLSGNGTENISICDTPVDFEASNITENSALVSWNSKPNDMKYLYKLAKANEDYSVLVSTVSPSFESQNLEPNTMYKVSVSTTCLNGSSEYSEDFFFTTLPTITPPTSDLFLKANNVISNQNEVEQSYTLEGDNTPLASYLTFNVTYTGVTTIEVLPSSFAISHRINEIAPDVFELRAVVSSNNGSSFGLTSGDELLKVQVTRSSTAEDCITAEITRVAAIDQDRNRLDIESIDGTICLATLADVTVRVKTADSKPVNNTRVIVDGQIYTTNTDGEVVIPYSVDTEFSALVEKDNFTISHAEFVEILDIAIANDLVIADEGEYPSYIQIAGDVNRDNENFLDDLDRIINAFFGDEFPWGNDTPDWVFTTIDATTNPFSPRYTEGIPARTITENTTIEVTAIALGDLDFEYARPTDRIQMLPLHVERKVEQLRNGEFRVSFITTNTADVEIFSARFEVEGKELTSQVFDLKHRSGENKLTVLGMDGSGRDKFVNENTVLLSFITNNPKANITSFEYVNENKIPYPILLKTDSEEGEEITDEIVIFPNPNKGTFFINSPEIGFVSIIDATGRTIFETEIEVGKNQVILPNAAKGMYNLIISSPSFSTVKKIVIE